MEPSLRPLRFLRVDCPKKLNLETPFGPIAGPTETDALLLQINFLLSDVAEADLNEDPGLSLRPLQERMSK
jgi:hypothetical protein